MNKFPSFEQYDKWHWYNTGYHATRDQYESAKARYENIERKAEAICQK